MNGGKSQVQDALAALVRKVLPGMAVRQEVPLWRVVADMGFNLDELTPELRHRPHAMSVDIVATDFESTIAFEYQGEQHYSTGHGRMNKTMSDVLWDQALDEEKQWVLERVGVPVVQVPFDVPMDTRVLSKMIVLAQAETREMQLEMQVCQSCGRRFPMSRLEDGLCAVCTRKSLDKESDDKTQQDIDEDASDTAYDAEVTDSISPIPSVTSGRQHNEHQTLRRAHMNANAGRNGMRTNGSNAMVNERQAESLRRRREQERARRKRLRDEYKQTPEYAERKQREREWRHARYIEAKARRDGKKR